MRRLALNAGLAAALLTSLALNWSMRRPAVHPAVEFVPNMVRTARSNAFEPNPNFADGATLRSPVPGTIPRGLPPLHYEASLPDARRAGEELVNPFSTADRAALERGAVVYDRFCRICHGADGQGNGPVVSRGFPNPPTLLRPSTQKMKDGQLFHILTYGQNYMASYAPVLSREDRWKVILHLRSLQQRGPPASTSDAR